LSLGGSSPYNSNKQEQIYTNETIQNTVNTNTHYQNTHTIFKAPTHYKTHTYTHPHIKRTSTDLTKASRCWLGRTATEKRRTQHWFLELLYSNDLSHALTFCFIYERAQRKYA